MTASSSRKALAEVVEPDLSDLDDPLAVLQVTNILVIIRSTNGTNLTAPF